MRIEQLALPVRRIPPLLLFGIAFVGAQTGDPLPSWNDGPAKRGIVEFVKRVTESGSPAFVPLQSRIAVFDNDGTLWPEKPPVEALFILSRIRARAEKDPSLKEKEPFKAALAGDTAYLKEAGEEAVAKLVAASHTGMTQEEFAADAEAFYRQTVYPKPGLPLTSIAYLPMSELLAYLRTNGFQTWICSGGTVEFMRAFSQSQYGIPPEQVIGSAVALKYAERDGKGLLMREPGLSALNDKEGKPVGISRQAGVRPIFAAGNVRSGGDIAMLTYSQGAPASFQLLINHDDGKREFAYQEPDGASLKAAKAKGWHVVSMKKDWKRVFSDPKAQPERVGSADER